MNDTPDITPEPRATEPAAAVSRRRLLGAVGAGAAVAGAALGAGGAVLATRHDDSGGAPAAAQAATVPFRGAHQAGIATPSQDRLCFATFDVSPTADRADLADLLRTWTAAAEAMAAGKPVPGDAGDLNTPPDDTGEAVGLTPGRLTVTIGYGPSLFDGRFGLAGRRPSLLRKLPQLPGENLDPANSDGDLCVQACADDPQVAFHAIRNLRRLGFGTVVPRWMELGFGRTSSTSPQQATPRNLMGFKDGTRNIDATDPSLMAQHVWIGDDEPQRWVRGGSYLVSRKIQMRLEQWDRDRLGDQQDVFGRFKTSGAPMTGQAEFDTPDFAAKDGDGQYVIPARAHIRLAAHENNNGLRLLRRGYSYTDGISPETGDLMGGLFFVAFMKSPDQFATLQRVLGAHDALNEYIQHIASGLFAVPPGLPAGQDWGGQLFG
ncbi:iron uptake transporter deferrochelatase/peroxidase subunit [Actinacidiphila sp. ITFR-21]|uniref:iron uptake transporter deferrochelatase/peroxidase subunit n=1 Tax=Actinacidiphila sp. ITFR-21 TaxID=3075199 RepID=UPI00288920F4|nr:iron uptake transporter deferrochelatase/peroxidase subunit [Streptomyces sp. ITFR-21]WNI15382.1 iron uptake transporter deferrochelatase/peroxidase subunit [Streptomyces sp. ITFR-21]